LTEPCAERDSVRETLVLKRETLNTREELVEVMLEQVFKEARGDGHPQIRLLVTTPCCDEIPKRLRMRFDELTYGDYGLPAII
jgi:hypothetical protein